MSQEKTDEIFRKEMQQRNIQPSIEAWDKLEVLLDKSEKKSPGYFYKYYGLAGVLLVVLIGAWVVKNRLSEHRLPGMVERENITVNTIKIEKIKGATIPVFSEKIEVVGADEKNNHQPFNKHQKSISSALKTNVEESQPSGNKVENAVQKTANEEAVALVKNKKVQQLIARVVEKHQSVDEVTDAEVDALLEKAQREVYAARYATDSGISVDAAALLMDVEDELNQTFKDKILNAIKTGFLKAKTAVAERNQ